MLRLALVVLALLAACHEPPTVPVKPVCQTKAMADTTTGVVLIVSTCVVVHH